MDRREAFAAYQRSMGLFSRDVVGTPLRAYQLPFADYILEAAAGHRNEQIVVELPRQSGKNEASAQIEVAILARMAMLGGEVVKTAPTWSPQIVNSMRRLEARSATAVKRLPFLKFRRREGYIYECRRAALAFLSGAPEAKVLGATASLLLEVDEAQDLEQRKFDRDFSPMRASTGAPVAFYGTPWLDTSLLERARQDVTAGSVTGKAFRVSWERVAEEVPAYGQFVEGEIRRLGKDHPLIRTQYLLLPLEGGGRMLKDQQLRLMLGDHPAGERGDGTGQIVAGIDFAGADEEAGEPASLATASGRDSVALTIGRADWLAIAEGVSVPVIRIVARYEWVNVPPVTLHTALYEILQGRWRVARVHCDATGVGSAATAFLASALNKGNRERVAGITFDSAWNAHSRLVFQYLAIVNGARLLDHQASFDALAVARQQTAPADDPARHAWWQRGHARLEARPSKRVRAYVPADEGHDDLLISELLRVDAAHALGRPPGRAQAQENPFYA